MKFFAKSTVLALAVASIVLLDAGVVSASDRSGANPARPAAIRSEQPGPARNSTPQAAVPSLGFVVANLSSHPIKLTRVRGNATLNGRPPDGSMLGAKSGFVHFFNVEGKFLGVAMAFADYAILGDDGQQIGTIEVVMQVVDTVFGYDRRNPACRPSLGTCFISPKSDVITLFDPPAPPPAGQGSIFLVYNLSNRPIKLINVVFSPNLKVPPKAPADGSILGPKSVYQRYELFPTAFVDIGLTAHYAILGDNGQESGRFSVRMEVAASATHQRASCHTPGESALCGPSPASDVILVHSAG